MTLHYCELISSKV